MGHGETMTAYGEGGGCTCVRVWGHHPKELYRRGSPRYTTPVTVSDTRGRLSRATTGGEGVLEVLRTDLGHKLVGACAEVTAACLLSVVTLGGTGGR